MGKIYDADEIKEIRKKLAIDVSNDEKHWQNSALQYLLSIVEELLDENESLWFMLDEEKNSKMTAKHSEMLNKAIENRLAYIKMLQRSRGKA